MQTIDKRRSHVSQPKSKPVQEIRVAPDRTNGDPNREPIRIATERPSTNMEAILVFVFIGFFVGCAVMLTSLAAIGWINGVVSTRDWFAFTFSVLYFCATLLVPFVFR